MSKQNHNILPNNVEPIVVKPAKRTLKAKWTAEAAEDLKTLFTPGFEHVFEMPADAIEMEPFLVGNLYRIQQSYKHSTNILMFLGYRSNKMSQKYHEFYFLVDEKIVCYYYLHFENAIYIFKQICKKPQK